MQRVDRAGDGDIHQTRTLTTTAARAAGNAVNLLDVLALAHHTVAIARGFRLAEVVTARDRCKLTQLAGIPDARALAVLHVDFHRVLHIEAEAGRAHVGAGPACEAAFAQLVPEFRFEAQRQQRRRLIFADFEPHFEARPFGGLHLTQGLDVFFLRHLDVDIIQQQFFTTLAAGVHQIVVTHVSHIEVVDRDGGESSHVFTERCAITGFEAFNTDDEDLFAAFHVMFVAISFCKYFVVEHDAVHITRVDAENDGWLNVLVNRTHIKALFAVTVGCAFELEKHFVLSEEVFLWRENSCRIV